MRLVRQQALDRRLEQFGLRAAVRGGLVEMRVDHVVVALDFGDALEIDTANQAVDHRMANGEILVIVQSAGKPLADLPVAGMPFEQADNLFVAAKAQGVRTIVIGERGEFQRHRLDTVAATAKR